MSLEKENISIKNYPSKDSIRVATMTLISKINCFINIKQIIESVKLEDGKIEKIKFGNKKKGLDSEELKLGENTSEKKVRKNKRKKKNFYNQVTIIIKPFSTRENGVNMKLSENGSIQMTGTTSIEEGNLTIRKMIEFLYSWNVNIFYRKDNIQLDVSAEKDISIDSSLENKIFILNDELSKIEILFMKCELIIVSFEIPFYIHLKKFQELLTTKYNLLSILGTSSYPGINTKMTYNLDCNHTEHIKKKKKYTCDCRDMSIFTFRTGKVIITGFENIEKIKTIFQKYIDIVKKEESIIKMENSIISTSTPKKQKNKIMKINSKIFEVVDDF